MNVLASSPAAAQLSAARLSQEPNLPNLNGVDMKRMRGKLQKISSLYFYQKCCAQCFKTSKPPHLLVVALVKKFTAICRWTNTAKHFQDPVVLVWPTPSCVK